MFIDDNDAVSAVDDRQPFHKIGEKILTQQEWKASDAR